MAQPELDLQMTDAEGRPLARFGGVAVPLSLREFPDKADGRARIEIGGEGRLQLEAWVPIRSLRIYLKQDLTLIGRHIKALRGAEVEYLGSSGNQVQVAVHAKDALSETFHTTVGCDALTLDTSVSAEHWAPPGHARGYLMTRAELPLFDQPGAEAKRVTSLHLSSQARGVLFYGDRREGEFIHVLYHHDHELAIDGWISAKDLQLVPRGELVDQSLSKYVATGEKRLQMQAEGQLHRSPAELALYGRADPKAAPIGSVPKDTELYVLDVVVGWASVLPRQLDVVPLADRQFWVKASALGF